MNCLVLCARPNLGIGVIRCLGSAGHVTYAMGMGARQFYRFSRHCAGYEPIDAGELNGSPEELAGRINGYCRQFQIDVIIPVDLPTSILADQLRRHLEVRLFPITDAATLERLHDKWTFGQLLAERGLPHPQTRLIARAEEVAGLDLAPPWIVKPRCGEGSVGVIKMESAEAVAARIRKEGEMLVQELIPGEDIDLSFLADHGKMIAWTIQAPGGSPHRRVFLNNARVEAIGRGIAEATGYHGVAHVDMRIDKRDGSVTVFEINPRFWNTLTHSLCMGVNFPDLGLKMMRGEKVGEGFRAPEGSCAAFKVTPWRLLRAAISSRPPRSLGEETGEFWRQIGADPMPELLRCFIRFEETRGTGRLAASFV